MTMTTGSEITTFTVRDFVALAARVAALENAAALRVAPKPAAPFAPGDVVIDTRGGASRYTVARCERRTENDSQGRGWWQVHLVGGGWLSDHDLVLGTKAAPLAPDGRPAEWTTSPREIDEALDTAEGTTCCHGVSQVWTGCSECLRGLLAKARSAPPAPDREKLLAAMRDAWSKAEFMGIDPMSEALAVAERHLGPRAPLTVTDEDVAVASEVLLSRGTRNQGFRDAMRVALLAYAAEQGAPR